jgi:hypothetical protein
MLIVGGWAAAVGARVAIDHRRVIGPRETPEERAERQTIEFLNCELPVDPPPVQLEWADNHALKTVLTPAGQLAVSQARDEFCNQTAAPSEQFLQTLERVTTSNVHLQPEWRDPAKEAEAQARAEALLKIEARERERKNAARAEAEALLKQIEKLKAQVEEARRRLAAQQRGNNPFAPAPSARQEGAAELRAKIEAWEDDAAKLQAQVEADFDLVELNVNQTTKPRTVLMDSRSRKYEDMTAALQGGYIVPSEMRAENIHADDIHFEPYVIPSKYK